MLVAATLLHTDPKEIQHNEAHYLDWQSKGHACYQHSAVLIHLNDFSTHAQYRYNNQDYKNEQIVMVSNFVAIDLLVYSKLYQYSRTPLAAVPVGH